MAQEKPLRRIGRAQQRALVPPARGIARRVAVDHDEICRALGRNIVCPGICGPSGIAVCQGAVQVLRADHDGLPGAAGVIVVEKIVISSHFVNFVALALHGRSINVRAPAGGIRKW